MSERKLAHTEAAVIALAALLALYEGTYFAMVCPDPTGDPWGNIAFVPNYNLFDTERGQRRGPRPLGAKTIAERIFAPAHWLDRRLRSRVWATQPYVHTGPVATPL